MIIPSVGNPIFRARGGDGPENRRETCRGVVLLFVVAGIPFWNGRAFQGSVSFWCDMWRTAFDLLVWFCPFSACNPEEKEGFGRAWRRNLETLAGTSVCFPACFPQLVGENCEFYGANRKICVPAQKTPTPFWSLLSGVDVLALLRNRFRIEENLLDVCQ